LAIALKQVTAYAARLASGLLEGMQRLDFRHRREGGAKNQKRLTNRAKDNDDEHVVIHGVGIDGVGANLMGLAA
jgi:hypothetical protein